MLQNILSLLNHEVLVCTMRQSLQADNRSPGVVNTAHPSGLVTCAVDAIQACLMNISSCYRCFTAELLGVSVSVSVLVLRTKSLTDGKRSRPVVATTLFFMSQESKFKASEDVQLFSATLQGNAAANTADSFRKPLYLIPA